MVVSVRSTYTTTHSLSSRCPTVMRRSSPYWKRSSVRTVRFGSVNTWIAKSKDIPCFARFVAALALSHSKIIVSLVCTKVHLFIGYVIGGQRLFGARIAFFCACGARRIVLSVSKIKTVSFAVLDTQSDEKTFVVLGTVKSYPQAG